MEVNPALIGSTLENYPLKTLLTSLAEGIADAQTRLDENSIRTANALKDSKLSIKDANGNVVEKSLLELGFLPTFYHFDSATIKVSVTITMKVEQSSSTSIGASLTVGHSTKSDQSGSGGTDAGGDATGGGDADGDATGGGDADGDATGGDSPTGGSGTREDRIARLMRDNTKTELQQMATDRSITFVNGDTKEVLAEKIIDHDDAG